MGKVGLVLMIAGIALILNSAFHITGFVIAENVDQNTSLLLGLILFIGGIFLFETTLEEKTGYDEKHNAVSYQKLKDRLRYMQDRGVRGFAPGKEPESGRYLTKREESDLKEKILRHVPKKYEIEEISIPGSLSITKSGKRTALNKLIGKSSELTPTEYKGEILPSDSFYLSDLDVGILSPELFGYLKKAWPESIASTGMFKDRATVNISTKNLVEKLPEMKFMRTAPKWVRSLLRDIAKNYKFVGEKRPVDIRILRDIPEGENSQRDIIYRS